MSALVVRELSKQFGGLQALDRVSFTVAPGERRAIIGPNGAGKTTLFHLISGALFPSTGTVTLFDHEITRMPPHRRARLGLARTFQITNLFPKLSVLDNVLLAVQASDPARATLHRPITAHPHLFQEARRLLDLWGLSDKADREVRHLSYGDQRQLELILALAGTPKLILLDEPTAGLSPAETASVVKMIQALDRNVTILLIEHDMDVAFELADRITVLHQGRILAEGTGETIRQDPQVTEIYLGAE